MNIGIISGGLRLREKVSLGIILFLLVLIFADYIVNTYIVLPSYQLPEDVVNVIKQDGKLISDTIKYTLSDFIIVEKLSGRVRVIWNVPHYLEEIEYYKLSPVFYIVSIIAIPLLIANLGLSNRLRDNIIEYVKAMVVPLLLAGILNITRFFGTIGYYFAEIVTTKIDVDLSMKYVNMLALYFLSNYSEKWVLLIGLAALGMTLAFAKINRDTVLGMFASGIYYIVLSIFYFATYALIIHLIIIRSSLINYLLALVILLLPIIRTSITLKSFEI